MRPVTLFGDGSRTAVVQVLITLLLSPVYWVPVLLLVGGVLATPLFLLGLPLVPLALFLGLGVSRLGSESLATFTGGAVKMEPPPRRWMRRLFGRRAWRSMAHCAVLAVWGTGAGASVLLLLSLGAALLVLPLVLLMSPADEAAFAGVRLTPVTLTLAPPVGVLLIWTTLRMSAPLAKVEGRLTTHWTGTALATILRRRVIDLETTRAAMVDAAEAERLRIERNLHDGAQQRLIAVALAIARARKLLTQDQRKALELLDEAHQEARTAVSELREIARGAHPPILTERGLAAAVTSTAQRQPLPVRLHLTLAERPSHRTEAVAYYVVSEILSNIAKHANALSVEIRLWRGGERLHLCILDDGKGGAVLRPGGGLAGLADRLRAVDGALTIKSPEGGPTLIEAELPWQA
ncbi:histidine kinase [Microbispora sp. KK1-11]|uniref:sensor histidine kinase n=1 Tax=Microbispora sp. KK1-11 TaxID=2053005 RepID=UPI00115B63C2|nr:histidine kinase [Microbispora sp. KK1-11]TQS28839.1 sensor histidine kinase [Microbispora sp. KK1-11]